MAANTWKKKTRKKRPGYHTIRLQRDDARQMATELMGDEDFVDAPEGLQNEEIRELPTAMHRKKAVQEEVKRAKRKEKRPSVFKTMGYSASLVSCIFIRVHYYPSYDKMNLGSRKYSWTIN
jgi:hypothetical protein